MPVIKKEILMYKCAVCGYEWIPRLKLEKPKQCPKCTNRNWDKEKERY